MSKSKTTGPKDQPWKPEGVMVLSMVLTARALAELLEVALGSSLISPSTSLTAS